VKSSASKWGCWVICAGLAIWSGGSAKGAVKAQAIDKSQCEVVSFEGEASAGQGYTHAIGNGMMFELEAVRAGWMVRVLPATGPRPTHDAAELATPPYNSVTPLAITTDYSFRAQDAVAWNPRRFQFAGSVTEMQRLQAAYTEYMAKPEDVVAGGRLAELAAGEAAGELQILDARLAPGTANQGRMAAAVAEHFEQTPHTTEQAGKSSQLGAVTWIRFRVRLHVPASFAAAAGLSVDKRGCR